MEFSEDAPWRVTERAQRLLGLRVDGVWGANTQAAYESANASVRTEIDRLMRVENLSPYSVGRVTTTVRRKDPSSLVRAAPAAPSGARGAPRAARVAYTPVRGARGAKGGGSTTAIKAVADLARTSGIHGASLANFLATLEIESGFRSRSEDHAYRSPGRAQSKFSALAGQTDAFVSSLVKEGKAAFFEYVYGHKTAMGRRLGNTNPGDGGKYYGRGIIQLTGRDNYERFSRSSGLDVVNNPDMLLNPEVSLRAAVWYWKTYVMARGADRDIVRATRVVNPALDNLGSRKVAAAKYASLLA